VEGYAFNPPPGWPSQPPGWVPPEGWSPSPDWPKAPEGWAFWVVAPPDAPPSPPAQTVVTPLPPPITPTAAASEPNVAVPPSLPTVSSLLGDPSVSTKLAEAEAELGQFRAEVAELQQALAEQASAAALAGAASAGLVDLDDERVLQEVGIYQYHHPLENAQEYRDRLMDIQDRIKDAIKRGDAVLASDMFTFNNSLARGRRMTSDYSKLMLRAYNAEADSCVRSLRAGNVVTAKKRLEASVESIARLGSMMEMRINPTYHQIRIEELELTSDFLMKVQEEREAAREERERLREERKAEQELAAERERLDKERAHYANALQALTSNGDTAGMADVAAKLETIDAAIAHNDFRSANIRAGYVYVISNTGAFGSNVVKIGMTRRLEPMDRVRELGDASVPFPFDVHALFFSADAVTLETELHKTFASMKMNHVNERREFFFATPGEVREVLAVKVGNLLEFTDEPEATQYLQSKRYWPSAH
jgi:hypothetical protein